MDTAVILEVGLICFGLVILQVMRRSMSSRSVRRNPQAELEQLLSEVHDGTAQHTTLLDSLRILLAEESPDRAAVQEHRSSNAAFESDVKQWSDRLERSTADVPSELPQSLESHGRQVGHLTDSLDAISNTTTTAEFSLLGQQVSDLSEANFQLQRELDDARRRLAEQGEQLRNAETAAREDPLTHLANRLAFDEQYAKLESAANREHFQFCVIMLDLDRFKGINDQHGHAAGDDVLRVAAMVLRQARREGDFAARFGGEEFVILCRSGNLNVAALLAEEIRTRIERAVVVHEEQEIAFTASFGIACRKPGESQEQFLRRADDALYAAKQLGRNRIHVADGQTPLNDRAEEESPDNGRTIDEKDLVPNNGPDSFSEQEETAPSTW